MFQQFEFNFCHKILCVLSIIFLCFKINKFVRVLYKITCNKIYLHFFCDFRITTLHNSEYKNTFSNSFGPVITK